MKRIALINPRYGLEASGSAEYYTRMIAEHLANRYEVEVLTTKAIDPSTWKDWYARDVETIHGVTVWRFSVEKLRAIDFTEYSDAYLQEMAQNHRNLSKEQTWFEKQGPFAPNCIRYIRKHRRNYNKFIFIGFDHYLTTAGLPEVTDRAILIPAAAEIPCFHFLTCESLFIKPKAFVFFSDTERKLVRRRFPRTEPIPCEVMGTGVDVPYQVDSNAFRQQYGLADPYLLYVGRVDESKGCPRMIRYFMEYKRRCGGKLKLVLIGKNACHIPARPDILSLGFVSDEEKYTGMAGAKALLVPYEQERMSISLLEAMSLSIPILANGSNEILRQHCIDSNGGLFYQNYFEFEGAVQYLMEHSIAYMQICVNAKNYVMKNYGWKRIMQKFDRLILK